MTSLYTPYSIYIYLWITRVSETYVKSELSEIICDPSKRLGYVCVHALICFGCLRRFALWPVTCIDESYILHCFFVYIAYLLCIIYAYNLTLFTELPFCRIKRTEFTKRTVIDYSSPNIAKEMHVVREVLFM